MESRFQEISCEFLVAGGGLSGICAALAAARKGVKTILIQDRPVLGGNASSEIRMHICGADYHMSRPNARETGILEEILLENKRRNPTMNYPIFNSVLWEKVRFQKNLSLYLNTYMAEVSCENGRIIFVDAYQMTTEKKFRFFSRLFMDATGDGTLGMKAGANYRFGREAASEFEESLAPDKEDHCTMGNSLMFQARDIGKPVRFEKPEWARTFTEEQLKHRDHKLLTSGYWWIELGGNDLNVIKDGEIIRDELQKSVFGMWDHIKNTPGHHGENMDLTWVGSLPGKRESRRLEGDYLLNQKDCAEGRIFDDAVAYGGWPMDIHTTSGLEMEDDVPTVWNQVKEVYTIPYRCLYSSNISNLFLGGRAISCTHVAFSSTRVMGTCAVTGQAVGTAAAIAIKKECSPREVGKYIVQLQQTLLRDDCHIPGFINQDENDLMRKAQISASDWDQGYEPELVINGRDRSDNTGSNCWQANIEKNAKPQISADFGREKILREIRMKFDSNLSREITPSINDEVLARQEMKSPSELIKEYDVILEEEDGEKTSFTIPSKGQRLQILRFHEGKKCRKLSIRVRSTYGISKARIFEIRAYEEIQF